MKALTVILALLLLSVVFVPAFAGAQGTSTSIWTGAPCAGGGSTPTDKCGLCDALIVASNIVQFLFQVAFPLTVGFIVYGAIRMMVSGASGEKIEEGKEIIKNAVLGLVIVLCSWLIVSEFLHLLSGNGVNIPWATITC
jgi:zinc transporter ZupT